MSGKVAESRDTPSFERFVRPELVQGLHSMGIVAPNSIQANAIPLALSGRDLMVSAQTGSGKTLVFMVPIVQRLTESVSGPAEDGPRVAQPDALVLVPTDELAMQVALVAEQVTSALPQPIVIECVTGQQQCLQHVVAPHVVISKPGLVLDLVQAGALSFETLRMVAIDEADTLLSELMGDDITCEADDILRMLDGRASPPQFFLTMAHLSEKREAALVRRFPHAQRIGETGVIVPTLRQSFHYFRGDKDSKLLSVIQRSATDAWLSEGTALVFCSAASDAERVHAFLEEALPSSKPMALHDEMPTDQRAASFRAFHAGDARLLVATDAAARGLDFPGLRHVIMYDMPLDVTSFVHCAGRTARRGQSGLVTGLVDTEKGHQFSYTSHHGLRPAPQLKFSSERG